MIHSPSPHLPLAAAVGIVALASTGCPPPLVDLGPYTTQASSDPDSGEGGPSSTPLTSTSDETTTATTTAAAPDTTAAVDETTTTISTTAVSATDATTDATTGDDSADTGTTNEVPSDCGDADPLHPFPAPFVSPGNKETHGECTLSSVAPPPGQPDQLAVSLFCRGDDPINFIILDGPLPEMVALKGKQLDVDINLQTSETGPELHWVVLSRDGNLIYAAVRGHTLLGEGVEGDAYAPLAFDTAASACQLAPTTSDWPPADPQGFACEFAAPIYLGVRVHQDPKLLLKAGVTLEAPVVGGKYRLEVRAVTAGHNCIPGFTPGTSVDTYSFAVASQAD